MNRNILIVDDDAAIRFLLKTHLTARGYACEEASDGASALSVLDREQTEILVTDLEMPDISGLELLAAVRTRGLMTRCVVVTGYATIANMTACLREGAVALVPKPLTDLAPLDQAVDEAFAQIQRWTMQMKAIISLRYPSSGNVPVTNALAPRDRHAR